MDVGWRKGDGPVMWRYERKEQKLYDVEVDPGWDECSYSDLSSVSLSIPPNPTSTLQLPPSTSAPVILW